MSRSREDERLYRREYRARKRAEAAESAPVSRITLAPSSKSVERAVQKELAMLPREKVKPALVEIAVSLARVLDDPKSMPQYASASRALVEVLAVLHGAEVHPESKLAKLRAARRAEESRDD